MPDSKKPTTTHIAEAKEVLEHLNIIAKKNFKPIEANIKFILGRLKDGYSVQDLKWVIDNMAKDKYFVVNWKYMRPETLFNATKFQTYVNSSQSPTTEPQGGAKHTGFTRDYYLKGEKK